jgi:peptidoglycan/LPS O-acetylase OafA/YrhL
MNQRYDHIRLRMKRLREIDFLRGIAILLVLCRHQALFKHLQSMGWIGVDLFFVLSGFLVSGLLFKEYLKFGNIQTGRFLIRRGFKIYPVYYIFTLFYVLPYLIAHRLNWNLFIADLLFVQNYVGGWGYAFAPSWSLAVEEHFYFALALALWFMLKQRKMVFRKIEDDRAGMSGFEKGIFLMMILCLLFRFCNIIIFPEHIEKTYTQTHFRIDSLLAGTLISYLYYFRFNYIRGFVNMHRKLLIALAIVCICWTPFLDLTISFFVNTIGFSLAYISFGMLLLFFLFTTDINLKLNKAFTKPVVTVISKIGYCSYSIYVIHRYIYKRIPQVFVVNHWDIPNELLFIVVMLASIVAGVLITFSIERFFLQIRDLYYPRRV